MPTHDPSKLKEKVRALPDRPGVYLMKDRLGCILYVGKAKSLKRRVSSYFQPSRGLQIAQPKVAAMLSLIHDFDTIEVKSEAEALLLEGRLIKEWRPKYNTEFTDDKRFLLLRVDLEAEMPRFRLVRVRSDERSRYFGPFVHSTLLRKTLAEIRRKYGVLLGDATPHRMGDGTWKLYDDVRAELYGQTNVVTANEYRKRVEEAMTFMEGKSREWLEDVRREMMEAAAEREYERAAKLRDVVFALEQTLTRTRKFVRDPLTPENSRPILRALKEALELERLPIEIECFDISHISGTFCVASMVHFSEGVPNKKQYRRFRIKSFVGNDDFRAMEEVVGRRYSRLHEEGRAFPDLVVIDGGLGQVGAAMRAFMESGLEPPFIIGLAKKNERIFFANGREPLDLPPTHEGRKLLQRIRDEAHRFANTYNADLRSQRIKETILDDMEGLGPVRRKALFEHFKTLDRIRAATPEELQEVDGIGPHLAERLADFLAEE
jgi:excinuclease ABC subunit C